MVPELYHSYRHYNEILYIDYVNIYISTLSFGLFVYEQFSSVLKPILPVEKVLPLEGVFLLFFY
jgi:hypothetical protein